MQIRNVASLSEVATDRALVRCTNEYDDRDWLVILSKENDVWTHGDDRCDEIHQQGFWSIAEVVELPNR